MAASSIRVNQVVDLKGIPYRLVERLSDGTWRAQNMYDRSFTLLNHLGLLESYLSEEMTLRVAGNVAPIEIAPSLKIDQSLDLSKRNGKRKLKLIMLPNGDLRTPQQQARIDLAKAKKQEALLAVAGQFSLGSKAQEDALRDAWKDIYGEEAPLKLPDPSTLYRWQKKLDAAGGDRRALIARNHLKGRRRSELTSDEFGFLADVVDDVYLSPQKRPIQDVVDELLARIRAENAVRPEDDQLRPVPYARVKEFIHELPAFDKYAARYGVQAARKKFRTVLGEVSPERPLQRVELDATRLDVIGIDDDGIPLGRPWLHICIDVCTRCILGFCISYEPPSLGSLFVCLKHALLPKTSEYLASMGVESPWPCYGAWERLVLDNGLENHSDALDELGALWGLKIQFCPRRKPWYKAKIERFLRTFNTQLCHSLPGATFSNIVERGDYNSQKEAVLHWRVIEKLSAQYINDVYHRRKHRSLGASPMSKWQVLTKEDQLLLPCSANEITQICRVSEVRRLTHKGIESLGLRWNSDDLAAMRQTCGADIDVLVFFDHFDLDHVGVKHPRTGDIIEVPSLDPAYTKGRTKYQHLVIRRYCAEIGTNDDVDGYIEAKSRIHKLVADASQLKTYATHGVAARFVATASRAQDIWSQSDARANPATQNGQCTRSQVDGGNGKENVTDKTRKVASAFFSIDASKPKQVSIEISKPRRSAHGD